MIHYYIMGMKKTTNLEKKRKKNGEKLNFLQLTRNFGLIPFNSSMMFLDEPKWVDMFLTLHGEIVCAKTMAEAKKIVHEK